MFDAIGFDPKTLTNEQLTDRQIELTRKRIQAARFGKADAVHQLQIMIQMIERERNERIFNDRIGKVIRDSSTVVVESDPTLKEEHIPEEDKQPPHAAPPPRAYPKPVRTTVPTTRQ
jgi:hypothetical protein